VRFTVDFERLPAAVQSWFLALPEGLGARRFFRANEFLNGYVDRLLVAHLDALEGRPVARPDHWNWMLRKLERAGLVELDPWGRLARRIAPEEDAAAVRTAALAESEDLEPSLALFDAARDGYVDFLLGKRSGADILLTPLTVPLWQKYFDNRNFGYAANNTVAASLCERFAKERSDARPLRVLELGGGLGSAAEAVAGRLGARIGRYAFTEAFPFFLASAKRSLARAFPQVAFDFAALDVNRPFGEQGAPAAGADLVVAVNVLHVSRHVGRTLAEIERALAPGGTLVMVECVRPGPGVPIYVDYPFQLLDEFFRIEDAGPARPHGGFLTVKDWRGLLERARLEVVAMLPDHDEIANWYDCYHLVGLAAAKRE
jgi:SAM-dependent methyltransferase